MRPESLVSIGLWIAVLASPGGPLGPRRALERPPVQPAALINIAKTSDLVFGELVTSGTLGTVVVTPAGARSATGGAKLGNASGARAAAFNITALPLTLYSIVLPASASLSNGASSMTVNTFTSTPSGGGIIGLGGSQVLSVGATLRVAASQSSGNYTGTFNVTVTVP